MAGGVVAVILRSFGDPRGVMAERIAAGPSEARALADLALACGLALVASMPAAIRRAQGLDIADAVPAAVSAHVFGYLFVAPLLFYALAALLHLIARPFGARRGFLGARMALFWAAVPGAAIALGVALAGVAVEIVAGARLAGLVDYVAIAGLAVWLWILAGSLAEAEGFGATLPVAGALVAGCLGLWGGLAVLSGAALG